MSANIVNQVSYLRTTREFPEDLHMLSVEVNKAYLDTANSVNNRTISIFPTNKSAVNGESWYFTSRRNQGFRQVYTFTSATSIPHGLDLSQIFAFVRIFGTFTDGSVWYPLPYVDVSAANNQINVIVNSTNIVISGGGGAGQPSITSGIVVLEWLANV